MEKQNFFDDFAQRAISGWAFALAILDDYAKVVAKLEGTEPEKVKERIKKAANKHLQNFISKIPPEK